MNLYKVILNPGDEMVLERAFNQLMKNIRRKELVDISAWKIICKWLKEASQLADGENN